MKKGFGVVRVLVLLLSLTLIFAACSSNSDSKQDAAVTNSANSADTGKAEDKVLRVRTYDDPAGYDPASVFRTENENIAFNIYSGLVSYDSKTGQIIPDLADKWESSDNKTWTFHLRKGVKWQKGYGELTAADVIYSYQRIIDPKTASPYANDFANVASVEAPDNYTVVYKLKTVDGNFPHIVANYHQGQIVKKEAVEKYGDQYKWNPVGTGPFELESLKTNQEIVLARNADYFKGPAPISKIIFSIIKDDDTAGIALQNGEVDLAMRIDRTETIERLQQAGFLMNTRQDRAVNVMVFNTTVKPLNDVKVRQAYAYAIDWPTIIKTTYPLLEAPTINLLPKWMDVYTSDVPRYDYNPEKSKQLLTEAGYPNGFTIHQLTTSSSGITEDLQLEQEYLKKVGIDLQFELVDSPTYNKRRNQGDYEISSRLLPAINPDTILFNYLHPSYTVPKGLNGARYDNPVLTTKLEAARSETNPEKRKQLYAEVQKIAMTDLPYMPYYSAHTIWPSYDYVINVNINPISQVNYYEVDMKPNKGK
ncbi:ABC transporter substrate-binding protein [Paenibacillus solisilvae]|uniref:ABC transporter substrate-binding protein n=1 Tax=Paenibacillus solisilvae TaxID=2486751 RepID=A0ABW0W035_9BACL